MPNSSSVTGCGRLRARAEDRIRNARATGLRNLPRHRTAQNRIWLEIVQIALDLPAWMPMLASHGITPAAYETSEVQGRRLPTSPARRSSVETELVALNVLHHDAGLVLAVGTHRSHMYRAERDQPCAFGFKRGQALLTHEPDTGPHVKM